jgi:hypothetical protein
VDLTPLQELIATSVAFALAFMFLIVAISRFKASRA